MKCFLNILLVALVLVIAPLTGADAKKSKKDLAHDACDSTYVSCSEYCDSLIDIDNQVENCRANCSSKYDSCHFWADRARVQGTTGNVGGASGGVLDPGPRGPSKKPGVTGQGSNAGAIAD